MLHLTWFQSSNVLIETNSVLSKASVRSEVSFLLLSHQRVLSHVTKKIFCVK